MKAKLLLGLVAAGMALPTASLAGWNYFDPTDASKVPAKFSLTGFYSNWAAKTVDVSAHYYDVNTPLWSDYAHKYRWVIVPAGKKIQFDPQSDYWDYPDSTVFVKLFKHSVTAPNDTTDVVWWETRVLVNKENEDKADYWYGFSYKWKPDGSEAYLLTDDSTDEARNVALTYYPQGKGTGKPTRERKWHYPTGGQCMQCHRPEAFDGVHGRTVLGFFTAQINRPSKKTPAINQITEYFNAGIMQWQNKGAAVPTAGEIATFPKWADIKDASASVDLRARSYIAANCSGCHGTRGLQFGAAMGVRVNYDFTLVRPETSYTEYEPSRQFGPNGEIKKLVFPGFPDSSAILFRQKARASYDYDVKMWQEDPTTPKPTKAPLTFTALGDQMPPLGVYEEDSVATKLLSDWIKNYKESYVSVRRAVQHHALRQPTLQGRNILLPEGTKGRVSLFSVRGQEIKLQRLTSSVYSIPANLRPGLYVVRVGNQSYTQYLF